MQSDRDIEFTPSPGLGATTGGVEFTPDSGTGSTGGQGGQDPSGGTVEQAMSKAQQLAGEAQQRAAEQVQSHLYSQKHRAAESLSSVAQSLRSSSQQLQGQQQDGVGRYIEQAADRIEGLAHYLQDRDVGDLVDEVEHFARQNRAAFLGGAFALGVLGARFLKSSRRNLVHEGVRERWSRHEMTSRIDDPERDAVGRPGAPGYAPPPQRASSEHKAAGPRE